MSENWPSGELDDRALRAEGRDESRGRPRGSSRPHSPQIGPASDWAREPTPLQALLAILRRRRLLVSTITLIVPIAALFFSLGQSKQYEAETSLLFRNAAFDQQLFGTTFFPESDDPARETATNIRLVSLEVVAVRTAEALPQLRLSSAAVSDKVKIGGEGESNIATITATDEDPRRAALIANTFSSEYIKFRQEADQSTLRNAQQIVQQQLDQLTPEEAAGPEGQRLRDRVEQFDVLATLQTGNAELVQRANAPTAPASPKPARNTAIGLVLGLLLGVGVALLREQVDRRLRTHDDVLRAYRLPLLGEIPRSFGIARDRDPDAQELPQVATEAFRLLRANLRYFNVDRQVRSVLVTSAAPRDGKTTVSWNLVIAEAQSGKRVLLIEADLRRPTLARDHKIGVTAGLSSVLAGMQSMEEATVSRPLLRTSGEGGQTKLDILYAGPTPPNPSELLESARMRDLLQEAEELYDLVVIDTPPATIVADAIPLFQEVDAVIVVSRLNHSERDAAEALREQLERLEAPVLGLVINGTRHTDSYYYRS